MTTYTDINGVPFTDADVHRWADEAEAGFPGSSLTREAPDWVRPEPMETHSVRVPASLWAQLTQLAHDRNITASEYAREVLVRSLAGH